MYYLVENLPGKKFITEPFARKHLRDNIWAIIVNDQKAWTIWLSENRNVIKWKKAV